MENPLTGSPKSRPRYIPPPEIPPRTPSAPASVAKSAFPPLNASVNRVFLVGPGEQFPESEMKELGWRVGGVRNHLLWPRNPDYEPRDDLATETLLLPTGPCWRDAMTTALLHWGVGDAHEVTIDGPVVLNVQGGLGWLRDRTRKAHRELTPLWRRKTGHQRVVLLDTPLGDEGFTLYDLVVGSPTAEDLALGALPDDPRIAVVLNSGSLNALDRRVALAWAYWQPNSWAEAAALAGAPDPAAYGNRVRRKLKRLGAEHTRRQTECIARGGGQP